MDAAELRRRRAQSQRDSARNSLREEAENIIAISRALQRILAQQNSPTPPVAESPRSAVPDENTFNMSHVSIMEARSDKFMRDVASLFNNSKYSDAIIIIHDLLAIPVHKFVICTQSAYFEKAFQESFIEGSSGELRFNDGSGTAHWRVLKYLYTGDYSDDMPSPFEDDPPLLKDARVYALGDMFFLEGIKALSTIKIRQKLKTLWACDSFPDCVREVYASTPDGDRAMRSAVVEVASMHARELSKKAAFKDLIREGGEFAVDFIESITESTTYKEPLRISGWRSREKNRVVSVVET